MTRAVFLFIFTHLCVAFKAPPQHENSVELKSRIPQEFSAKSGSKTRSSVTVDISFDVLVIIGSLGKGFCIF